MTDELVTRTVRELAGLVASRDVSAVEVVQAHLRRIDEVNPAVNAVVARDDERTLAAARDADALLAGGGAVGPLHGVPFTVKDNISAAGLTMAVGVPARRDVVADRDATVVSRMREAGAILLGKTNLPPWGGGTETDNEVYGRTDNPYDRARTPGGSSGGEAAAIAALESPCGFGTDSGASVRLPAHFCGLAALKPTTGRVPVTGVLDDEGELGGFGDPRTVVGPVARSVADVALLLSVVAGPDGRDGGVPPVALGDPAAVLIPGMRVAVHHDGAQPETVQVVESVAAALSDGGARVVAVPPPAGGHDLTQQVWRSYGGDMSSLDLYRLLRRWDAFRTETLRFFGDWDLLLTPVFPGPARRHGTMNDDEVEPTGFTTPQNLSGAPAATVRAGTSAEGLPIGVQLSAAPWRDDVALAAAAYVEQAFGGYVAPPL
jgi:amidase